MIPKALESMIVNLIKKQLKKHIPKIGDKIPPNLKERIEVLEKKVDLIQDDIQVVAVTNDKQLGKQLEKLETLAKLLKKS